MLSRIIAKIAIRCLSFKELNQREKMEVLNALIKNLNSLPIYAIIEDRQGSLFVNGKAIDYEQAIQLRESARGYLNNHAAKLVDSHLDWLAIQIGVHQSQNTEQVIFSKAALWLNQEKKKLLQLLAGEEELPSQ